MYNSCWSYRWHMGWRTDGKPFEIIFKKIHTILALNETFKKKINNDNSLVAGNILDAELMANLLKITPNLGFKWKIEDKINKDWWHIGCKTEENCLSRQLYPIWGFNETLNKTSTMVNSLVTYWMQNWWKTF